MRLSQAGNWHFKTRRSDATFQVILVHIVSAIVSATNIALIVLHYQFSLKESVYKAMHPILCEYVGLQEAEVDPLPDGNAVVRLNFLTTRGSSMNPRARSMVVHSASWRKVDDFFLTSASIGLGSTTT